MSVAITKTPARTATSGNSSEWVAAHSPVIFEFQRRDINVVSVTNSGGYAVLNTTGGLPADVKVGNQIYVYDPFPISSTNDLNGIHTITAVGTNTITLDKTFSWTRPATYANMTTTRYNYYIELKIREITSWGTKTVAVGRFYDDPKGKVVCDISDYILALLDLKIDGSEYYGHNYACLPETIKFEIKYTEYFTSDEASLQIAEYPQGDFWYATKSALQLGEPFDSNMRDYVTYPDAISKKAKWITDFEQPRCWKGYPWHLSVIYSEKEATNHLNKHIQQRNVNFATTTTEQDWQISANKKEALNRITSQFNNIQAGTTQFEMWLETGAAISNSGGGGYGGGGGSTADTFGEGGASSGYFDASDYVTDQTD